MSSVPVALAGARIVTVVTSDCFGARSEAAGVTRAPDAVVVGFDLSEQCLLAGRVISRSAVVTCTGLIRSCRR